MCFTKSQNKKINVFCYSEFGRLAVKLPKKRNILAHGTQETLSYSNNENHLLLKKCDVKDSAEFSNNLNYKCIP